MLSYPQRHLSCKCRAAPRPGADTDAIPQFLPDSTCFACAHTAACARVHMHFTRLCGSVPHNFTRSVGVCHLQRREEWTHPTAAQPLPSRAACTGSASNLLCIFTTSSFQEGVYGKWYCGTSFFLAARLSGDPPMLGEPRAHQVSVR